MICDCKLDEKNCDIFLQKIVKIFEEKNRRKVSIMPKKSLFLFFKNFARKKLQKFLLLFWSVTSIIFAVENPSPKCGIFTL